MLIYIERTIHYHFLSFKDFIKHLLLSCLFLYRLNEIDWNLNKSNISFSLFKLFLSVACHSLTMKDVKLLLLSASLSLSRYFSIGVFSSIDSTCEHVVINITHIKIQTFYFLCYNCKDAWSI
jgi:hypothetical protein